MASRSPRKLAVILHADVVGSTSLVQRDESVAHERIQEVFRRFSNTIQSYGGTAHEIRGDALVAEFSRASDAICAGLAYQAENARFIDSLTDEVRPKIRIGVSLGEVVVADQTITGAGVVLAQRLEQIAEPGGICLQGAAYETVPKRFPFSYQSLGEQTLKGFDEPVRAYSVHLAAGEHVPAPESNASEQRRLESSDRPSVAVLAFTNMSNDPDQDYFSDGITEDIITELSKISGLFVIARHSTFTYKGESVTLARIGRELGARYVLEGSVRKAGKRLRITAQLTDVTTDYHVWAERYDRSLDDIFAVQDDVARSVSAALSVALSPGELERVGRPPTENIASYDLYLRIRSAPWPPTRENILTAHQAYMRIIGIAPTFVGGHAGAALTSAMSVMFGHSAQPVEDAETAIKTARKALAIDDAFALSHSALGLALSASGRRDEGILSASRAVELQPSDSDAYAFLAITLISAGKGKEACEAAETALRLDPQYIDGPYLNILGVSSFVARDYDKSIDAFRRNLERGGPIGLPALAGMAASYAAAGRLEKARMSVQELLRFVPGFSVGRSKGLSVLLNTDDLERLGEFLRKAGLPE